MTLFFNYPPGYSGNHPLSDRVRKLFLVPGFRDVDSVIEASYVVEFRGSKPTGLPDERRIFAYDFRYGIPAVPKRSLLVDLGEGVVPRINERGYYFTSIPIRQYLLEFPLKDYAADALL